MRRVTLRLGLGVATGAALILALVLGGPYVLDLPRLRGLAAASASQALGRPVRFTSVSVRLLPVPRVELHGLEVAEDPRFGTAPFVTLERGFLSLRLLPLLGGRLEFGHLRLERPLIRLVEGPDGTLNVASLAIVKEAGGRPPTAGSGRDPSARSSAAGASLLGTGIAIEDGSVSFAPRTTGRRAYRLVGLDLQLRGDGSWLAVTGRARLTPGDAEIQLADGRLGLRGVRSAAEAPIGGRVSVTAADLRPLIATLVPPELGVSGPLEASLALSGVLGAPRASGRVRLAHATISRTSRECRPPERMLGVGEIAMGADWAEGTLVGRPVTARAAGGSITANLSATLAGGLRVVASDVAVHGLSLEPVLVEFLCHGYAITGRLALTGALALQAPGRPESVSSDGRFQIGRGRVVGPRALRLFGGLVEAVDLAAAVAGEARPSPFEFESITGSYRLRHGVAVTRDLVYTGRGFTAQASGEYTLASGGLDVDLLVRHRREQLRARVTGTAEAPVLRVDAAGSLRAADLRQLERELQGLLRRFR